MRRRYLGLLGQIRAHRGLAGRLRPAVEHFLKVTKSYWPGLFHCYAVPDLPRTNNDLEQVFGRHRHHQRRCRGHRSASRATPVRGDVRVIAFVASRSRQFDAANLTPTDAARYRAQRRDLAARRATHASHRRFRRNPHQFLQNLERRAIPNTLPS